VYTRFGLVVSTLLAVVFAIFFRSAVDIWHAFGSIGTPALLVPVFFGFVGRRRLPPNMALLSVVASGGLSLVWYLSKYVTAGGTYWFGIEPVFPGLLVSIVIFLLTARRLDDRSVLQNVM
jgi:Na+/pantothenate symporter